MKRQVEFKAFLRTHNLPEKYLSYCEKIEKAFQGKDMDDIILSQQNLSKVREKLKKVITQSDNSISQYITALNSYLKFAFSATTLIATASVTPVIPTWYYVSRAKGVALTAEVEFVCQILEQEYKNVVQFAKELFMQGSFETIPIIVSDEKPMQESPQGPEKVLGKFFPSAKPYIEIYYHNFKQQDAAAVRNCLAHEYLHYLHYSSASKEFSNAVKDLTEGMADFFGMLYSIHRHEKDDLSVAKKRYNLWKKNSGTYWPYANALYFLQVRGKEMKYSSDYNKYANHGCIRKFVQVFASIQHPENAYTEMLNC